MSVELIVALAMAVPIVILPAAFVWYLNIGGLRAVSQEKRARRRHRADSRRQDPAKNIR
jgi:hypothetical protein